MKLSIAIADSKALPTAFVVFRGIEESIAKAARLGFQGVELALRRADEIHPGRLKRLLDEEQIEVSCISTGQVYADGNLMLTDQVHSRREEAIALFKEFIELSVCFGGMVSIGRIRGLVGSRNREEVEQLFISVVRGLADYAQKRKVTLLLEPINRYETDFINNIEEGVALLQKIDRPNLTLMPDLFHMNIEEVDMGVGLADNLDYIKYIHVADSNRMAPGYGHTDFTAIFNKLEEAGYDNWLCAEILPLPSADAAARQAAGFLQHLSSQRLKLKS